MWWMILRSGGWRIGTWDADSYNHTGEVSAGSLLCRYDCITICIRCKSLHNTTILLSYQCNIRKNSGYCVHGETLIPWIACDALAKTSPIVLYIS